MSWADLVAAAEQIRADAVARGPELARSPLAGIGWASVEHERAQAELDGLLDGNADGATQTWTELERDPLLGARGWLRATGTGVPGMPASGMPALIVLEADTEGRLAASLARFGEGVAVVYLGEGPAGPGRLVRGGRAWGPHVIVT